MKIRINFELLDKIKASKKGLTLKKGVHDTGRIIKINTDDLTEIKILKFISWMCASFNALMLARYGLPVFKGMLAGGGPIFCFLSGFSLAHAKRNKEKYKDDALKVLESLAGKLKDLEVRTSAELLQESEVIETRYELKREKSKILLNQKKYIKVPLNSGYDETLVQEHVIGTDEYDLSVGTNEKVKTLKLVRNHN